MVAPEPRRSAGDTLFEVSPLDFGPMPSLQARAVRSVVFGFGVGTGRGLTVGTTDVYKVLGIYNDSCHDKP